MKQFFISSLLTAVSSLGFGILVLVRSSNPRLARKWALFVTSVALWGAGAAWIALAKDPHTALILWRLVYVVSVVWISPLFYHFVCAFLERSSWRSVCVHYWIALAFAFAVPTHAFFPFTRWMFGELNYARGGWLFYMYCLWWWGLVIYSHIILAGALHHGLSEKKNQIRYFFLATAIGFSGGIINFCGLFGFNIYPWGQSAIPLYPVIMSYAMLKHQLMDVRLVIRKTLVYSGATLSLTIVYVALLVVLTRVLEGWVGAPSFYSSVVAAVVIAVLFHPVRTRIQVWLDRRFPRESLNQEMLREVTGHFVHEIKRPLANISMPAQLTLMDLDAVAQNPAEFGRLFPKLRERMKYIVDESLNVSQKIEAIRHVSSQASIERHSVDIGKLVSHLVEQERWRIHKEAIQSEIVGADAGNFTRGDSAQIEIAIANVLKNGIDALSRTPSGRPRTLRITVAPDKEWLEVGIENSGPSISPVELPHLFDPWFTTKGSGGMGIGLYLTREIMREHDARIEVTSHSGSTLFRLIFHRE